MARPMEEILETTVAGITNADEIDAKEARLRAIASRLGVDFDDL